MTKTIHSLKCDLCGKTKNVKKGHIRGTTTYLGYGCTTWSPDPFQPQYQQMDDLCLSCYNKEKRKYLKMKKETRGMFIVEME